MKYLAAIGMGLTIIAQILGGLGIGYLIDKHFDTTPICLIVGLLLGTLSAFLWLYRLGKENA